MRERRKLKARTPRCALHGARFLFSLSTSSQHPSALTWPKQGSMFQASLLIGSGVIDVTCLQTLMVKARLSLPMPCLTLRKPFRHSGTPAGKPSIKMPRLWSRPSGGWARLLLHRARDLITHGPAHRGANGAAMPTDEDDQDGHFSFNHPERGGYSAA